MMLCQPIERTAHRAESFLIVFNSKSTDTYLDITPQNTFFNNIIYSAGGLYVPQNIRWGLFPGLHYSARGVA